MMPRIIYNPAVFNDLYEIWHYIASDNENRAHDFVATFDEKFHLLAKKPTIGRLRDELMDNLRSLPHGRYIIFYRPVKNGVEIVRVLHGARDLATIFPADEGA